MSALFNLFYLYDPWLFHFFRTAFFVGIVALAYLAYKWLRAENKQGIFLPLDSFGVIIALILFSFIPLLIHGTRDFSVIVQYTKTLILFIFAVGIFNVFYAESNGQQKAVRDLKIGIGVQAALGFLALAGVSFAIDFALSTNVILPNFYGSEQEYRLYNLTSSAFFQLSAFYLMLLHFLLAYNQRHNNISAVFLFLLLCIGLISGRTFLMLSVISIALYFKWRYVPALLAFGGLCVFLAMNYAENKYVAHALEPLINLLNHQGLSSSSTDTLMQKHLFIPTLKQILIGDGYYVTADGKYYGLTDSGFLRQTLYGGIVNVAVCFAFTAYFVRKIALVWFNGSWRFILSALFILSVLNVKADTYAFPGIMLVLLMFLSLFGQQGKYKILFPSWEKS
ncbi:hypothetical protein [Caviibacterium pharyngocola]|uniref:Uncharacterized protein n=1 Tax=Caviibacterium pharyngocola TaxID=28159 RepID=A0A2M8RTJ5_9PAST|nr:hypothetical protein [Caviibacterium pharyngocola]PJG82212.1 hypothetical protein CVP04_10135 [Caviibacterium pharyngocola]